jgi:2-(1,2-epoxy-1,2-dihydrophenyl)acetyl-CoA isomerase
MAYGSILYDVSDQIATITLNRPERMNSFGDTLVSDWADAIRSAQEDNDVRVVLVTGAGRAFCAGADLKAATENVSSSYGNVLDSRPGPGQRRNSLRYSVHRVPQALDYLDKPYVAAVNGAAVGAGMDMVSMADIRIASDQARFGMSYVNVGLIPGDGGAWLLPRIVGTQKALELIWSGELFDAQAALEMGYVSRVVPHDDLMTEARAYAAKLASGPPIAMQMAKRLVYRGLNQDFMEGLEAAQAAMTIAQSTEDSAEGPRAFREKRAPEFHGR